MQGFSEVYLENYEEVTANTVMPMVENPSGDEGSYFRGIRILWTTEEKPGGVTGKGWYTNDSNSPFFGCEENEIVNYAEQYGNLNSYFTNWVNNTSVSHESFIHDIDIGCWALI